MPNLFTIDNDIKQLFQDGIDTIIDQLGKDFKLILDGSREGCPNCPFDSSTGKSAGVYNGTGPRPFTKGPCPVCKGTGFNPVTAERVEIRRFTIKRDLKPNQIFPPGTFDRPVTITRIKGYAKDLPIVMQAKSIILDYVNAIYTNERYTRISEPGLTGSIVSGRYFVCYLQRSN